MGEKPNRSNLGVATSAYFLTSLPESRQMHLLCILRKGIVRVFRHEGQRLGLMISVEEVGGF